MTIKALENVSVKAKALSRKCDILRSAVDSSSVGISMTMVGARCALTRV